MAITYDELMKSINDQRQAMDSEQRQQNLMNGGVGEVYKFDGLPLLRVNNTNNDVGELPPGVSPPVVGYDFSPYYYDPNHPYNKGGTGKWYTLIGKNKDGSINTDGGYFGGDSAWKQLKPVLGVLAAAAGGAYLSGAGAGAGVADGVGATMFPGEALGFNYGGLNAAGLGTGTMFPGEVSGFDYGALNASDIGGGTMFPGESAGFDYASSGSGLPSAQGAVTNVGKSAIGSVSDAANGLLGSKAGAGILGGLLGGAAGAGGNKDLTETRTNNLDPRMASILYGDNNNKGFLSKVLESGYAPQTQGMAQFGRVMDEYLGNGAQGDVQNMRTAADRLMSGNINSPSMSSAQISAPSQNELDLKSAYNDMIYGEAGANPYLTGAIQKGINQATNAFQNLQSDATRNLTQNILPSIRSGAQVSGQYGGSRQALSEGRALQDFSTQMGRAASQFGQNATDSAIAARAGAYDTDRSRALSAMSGLGAQQYGVAGQNAALQQQANQANLQSKLSTNSLNSANKTAGIGALSGLVNQAYNIGGANDLYSQNKLGKTAGILAPFTGLNSSQTVSQPTYSNPLGNVLGGVTAGLGLYNAYNKL